MLEKFVAAEKVTFYGMMYCLVVVADCDNVGSDAVDEPQARLSTDPQCPRALLPTQLAICSVTGILSLITSLAKSQSGFQQLSEFRKLFQQLLSTGNHVLMYSNLNNLATELDG